MRGRDDQSSRFVGARPRTAHGSGWRVCV